MKNFSEADWLLKPPGFPPASPATSRDGGLCPPAGRLLEAGAAAHPSEDPAIARAIWIPTASGRRLYPLDLRPEDIHLLDLATGLANAKRWSRQGSLTTAQHSVTLSRLVAPAHAMAALMHDATDGLGFGDWATPMKLAFPEIARAEHRAMAAVAARFGFAWPLDPEVAALDKAICADEWRLVFPGQPVPAELGAGTGCGLARIWSERFARDAFVERYFEIERARGGA